MVDIAYVGSHAVDAGTTTPDTLTMNLVTAGAQTGHFAIAIGEFSSNDVTISTNRTGWTLLPQINVSTTLCSLVMYKTLTATDISNATVSMSVVSNTRCAAGVMVLSGVHPTDPLDPVSPNPTTTSESVNDQTNPFASINPIDVAFMVCMQANNYAAGGTGVTWPSGWTKRFEEVTAHASQRRAGVSGATYNSNPTSSFVAGGNTVPDVNAHSAAYTFALKPAPDPLPNDGRFFQFI